jgi:NDP-sugar pyrophosphorylase family protein
LLTLAILAGGLAKRLRPVTESLPKALVPVAGEPFLAHQLRLLRSRGVGRVVLCVGYLGDQVQAFGGDGRAFGIELEYSFDGGQLLGTAGALRKALPLLGDQFLVMYGDSYLPCDFQAAERRFLDSGKLGLMTVFRNEGQWDASNVEFRDGEIVTYSKQRKNPNMHYIDYGLGALRATALDCLPEGPSDLATVYEGLAARGQLAAMEVSERFYEIGSFTGLSELEERLAKSGGVI